jgi:hypothetical protein
MKAPAPAARGTALQPKMAAGAGGYRGNVIQAAGTKPRSFSANGKYLIKLSSDREEFIYQQRGALGLNNVMAGYYDEVPQGRVVNGQNQVTHVTINKNGHHKQIALANPIGVPTNTQRIIVMDTLGYERPQQNQQQQTRKFVMDIKIGTYTKSTEQFEIEGAGFGWRLFKKLEHNVKDLTHGSRTIGFDICDGSDDFDTEVQNLRTTGTLLEKNGFKAAIDAILIDLAAIQNAVQNSSVTFVGSSVFCIFNLTNPQSSLAKLIDPDHPIMLNDNINGKPNDVMSPNKMAQQNQASYFQRDWNQYQQKWTQSFNTGIANLITHFQQKKVLVDTPIPQFNYYMGPLHGPIGGY